MTLFIAPMGDYITGPDELDEMIEEVVTNHSGYTVKDMQANSVIAWFASLSDAETFAAAHSPIRGD